MTVPDPVTAETARLIQAGVTPHIAATVAPIGARHRPRLDETPPAGTTSDVRPPANLSAPTGTPRPHTRSTPALIPGDLDAWFAAATRSGATPTVRRAGRYAVAQLGLLRIAMDALARVERRTTRTTQEENT